VYPRTIDEISGGPRSILTNGPGDPMLVEDRSGEIFRARGCRRRSACSVLCTSPLLVELAWSKQINGFELSDAIGDHLSGRDVDIGRALGTRGASEAAGEDPPGMANVPALSGGQHMDRHLVMFDDLTFP